MTFIKQVGRGALRSKSRMVTDLLPNHCHCPCFKRPKQDSTKIPLKILIAFIRGSRSKQHFVLWNAVFLSSLVGDVGFMDRLKTKQTPNLHPPQHPKSHSKQWRKYRFVTWKVLFFWSSRGRQNHRKTTDWWTSGHPGYFFKLKMKPEGVSLLRWLKRFCLGNVALFFFPMDFLESEILTPYFGLLW